MKSKILLALLLLQVTVSCNDTLQTAPTSTSLNRLIEGNQRFLKNETLHPHQDKNAVLATEDAQHPYAVVITCADSRVSPEIIFDQGIGDLFVIRNAGNLMSDFAMGSVEYAVEHLNTDLVIVLGHTECGAIKAYIEDAETKHEPNHHDHIESIITEIKNEEEEKLIKHPSKANLNECIVANILHSTHKILHNPFLDKKKIEVVPMIYDVHTGKVEQIYGE